MNKYIQSVSRLNYCLFIALFASLPLPRIFPQVMLIAWAVAWLFEGRFLHRANLRWDRRLAPVLGLTAWVLWETLSLLWGQPDALSTGFNTAHVALLILPFVLLFGMNERYRWKTIAAVFVVSCVVSVFLYAFTLYWVYNHNYVFADSYFLRAPFTLSVFDTLLSPIKHRLYYCTLLTLALVLLFMLRNDFAAWWGKVYGYAFCIGGALCMLGAVVATYSRASLFTLVVVAAVALVRHTAQRYRVRTAAAVSVLAVIAFITIWQVHPKMKNLTLDHIKHPYEYMDDPKAQPRLAIWFTALQHPEDYVAKGLGVGNSVSYLVKRYQAVPGTEKFVADKSHAHNQYLEICMELGMAAMLLFVILWVALPCCYSDGTPRAFATYLSVVFGLNMLTDRFLTNIEGVVFLCAFLLFLACIPSDRCITTS